MFLKKCIATGMAALLSSGAEAGGGIAAYAVDSEVYVSVTDCSLKK